MIHVCSWRVSGTHPRDLSSANQTSPIRLKRGGVCVFVYVCVALLACHNSTNEE